jgi:DnaJ-class molecular chaperone
LELVRQYPPDRAPERFVEIHQAYEKLRDPVVRVESKLFDLESGGSMATSRSLPCCSRFRTSR